MDGALVRLRGIEESDAQLMHTWGNDPDVRALLDFIFPIPLSGTISYIREMEGSKTGALFIIIDKETETPIGFSGIFSIDWIARKAEFGIIIGDKQYWSRGYGGDATTATLSFAFDDLGLHRVYLNTYSYNPRAVRCYETCGFSHEGILRKARYRHGTYHDIVRMGILRDEFYASGGRCRD